MFLFSLQLFTLPRIIRGLFVAALLLAASPLLAADVLVAPSTGSYSVGQTFTTAIRVAPGGTSVNAVEASLAFDSALLSVVSVSKDGSVFSLWTTEPTFSNTAGTVTFGGGSPSPFTSQSNLVSVTFRTLAAGTATVRVSDASVLAADGRGTDVYENGISATYTVTAGTTPPPAPPTTPTPTPNQSAPAEEDNNEAIVFGDPPRAPEVGSQAFLDQNVWYRITDGIFSWTLPFDVSAVAITLSAEPLENPEEVEDAVFDPPVDEFVVNRELVQDGVQYLNIKYENQVGWGAVLNRKIQIDTTPPELFEIVVRASNSTTGFPQLNFEADDTTSGIDYYTVTIADKEPFTVTPDEARLGYLLRELVDGTYTVKVVAHDLAGNTRESSAPVLITAGWTQPIVDEVGRSVWDYLTFINLLIVFLVVIVILQFVYFWHERKVQHQREEKLRRETREIQDQMEKIFSALRDEIYDQINMITKRKRLSQKEKEAVEGLNQALEVSETLIEKEINDVKSILK